MLLDYLNLTENSCSILQKDQESYCTFEELLRDVCKEMQLVPKKAVEAAIHRIRSYLLDTEQQPNDMELIQNVRGKGYIYKPKLG